MNNKKTTDKNLEATTTTGNPLDVFNVLGLELESNLLESLRDIFDLGGRTGDDDDRVVCVEDVAQVFVHGMLHLLRRHGLDTLQELLVVVGRDLLQDLVHKGFSGRARDCLLLANNSVNDTGFGTLEFLLGELGLHFLFLMLC